MKSNKDRLDSNSKMINSQFESSEKEMKGFMRTLIESSETTIKYEIENVSKRMNEIKLDNIKQAVNFQKAANELKSESDKILTMKSDVITQLDSSTKEYKESTKDAIETFEKIKNEFDVMKVKFSDLAEFIKVMKVFN